MPASAKEMDRVLKSGEMVAFSYGFISHDVSEEIMSLVNDLLDALKKSHLKEAIGYFVREFISNANKSNLKRVHFRLLDLDILDPEQYAKGMKTFGKEFRDQLEVYGAELEKCHMYTHVCFQVKEQVLTIEVRNSHLPVHQEEERVSRLIEQSKSIHDTAEAFMSLSDSSEGAGLGVVTTVLMIRSLGLPENAFEFFPDAANKETVARVAIPLDTVPESIAEDISTVIAREIKSIPTFPEKITLLEEILADSDVQFSRVAQVIQSDVALTAELLKMVNSAQYMLPQKVSNIQNAISLIGVKGLRNLIYSFGAQKLLQSQYGSLEDVWEHAYRVASYAYHLAKDNKQAAIADDAYIGGILHDIGKIVIMITNPGLQDTIQKYCAGKGIVGNLVEHLALGSSHARIGMVIGENWNFPEPILAVIEFHHKPLLAPPEYKEMASLIYLADKLTHRNDANFAFSAVEKSILERYGIPDANAFTALEKKLNIYYQEQKAKGN